VASLMVNDFAVAKHLSLYLDRCHHVGTVFLPQPTRPA